MASTRELQGKKNNTNFPTNNLMICKILGKILMQLHACSRINATLKYSLQIKLQIKSPALQTSSHTVKMFLLCE